PASSSRWAFPALSGGICAVATSEDRDDEHLVERLLEGGQVYAGHFLDVRRDRVALPDGRTAHREYIRHPGAVMVVPLLDDGRLLMERQYCYPVARVFLEF